LIGATEVNAVIQKENGEHIKSLPLSWSDLDNEFDVYAAKIDTNELGVGLYYYYIVISAAFGKIYASKSGRAVSFSKDMTEAKFQFSISQFDNTEPSPFSDGIIYHIFVDRFARGRQLLKKEGAVYPEDWSSIPEFPSYPGAPLKNNTFYGGSLDGITERLDYISSLGTTLIYLSPIFESPSNHKYDTADYMKVDEMFGGEKSLVRLIKEAKKRGIGIILDGVFNHTGADSVYFNRYGNYGDGGAYRNKNSEYFDWFEFKHYPEDYTCWWGIEILPRLNTKCTSCMDFFVGKNGVIEKYSKLGIAGFRLDVADELSDAFIKKIKKKLTEINKANILYGEVWEDASNKIAYGVRKKYYLGSELDGVMNYPLRKGLIDYAKNKSTHELEYALTDIINNAPTKIRNMQMNLLGTHDTERIITALVGQSGQERTNTELSTLRLDKIKKD
jgi:glycosidase